MPSKTEIIDYLDSAGIKLSNSGFRYLISIIELGSDQPDNPLRISDLYYSVADRYHTTPVRVERSIRYSIQGTRQTNKEFLSRAILTLMPTGGRTVYPEASDRSEKFGVTKVNLKMKKRAVKRRCNVEYMKGSENSGKQQTGSA